ENSTASVTERGSFFCLRARGAEFSIYFKEQHMSTMTPGERVQAAVKGEQVDRVPFCFWHHFKPEGSGERLAQLTFEFFVQKFNLDIVKIMPDLPYPAPEQPPTEAEQVKALPRLDLTTPMFR